MLFLLFGRASRVSGASGLQPLFQMSEGSAGGDVAPPGKGSFLKRAAPHLGSLLPVSKTKVGACARSAASAMPPHKSRRIGDASESPTELGDSLGAASSVQRMAPSEFLKKFSEGEARLIPLDQIGICPRNRFGKPLNGSNIMNLMEKWQKGQQGRGENFQQYRYKVARCVAPDDADLHACEEHTNRMADRDQRIRAVKDATGKGLYGMFSKSHMWSALWGTVGGAIRVGLQPDGALMRVPQDQPDFVFAAQHGIWCEVISAKGLREHPDTFDELMRSENFDANQSLAEDEMSLLVEVANARKRAKDESRISEHEFDTVTRLIVSKPGNIWRDKDIECRYNLEKTLGASHLEYLELFTSTWVDFTKLTVSNVCVASLASFFDTAPWLKVCLYAFNYTSDVDSCQRVAGGKSIANNWTADDVAKLKKWATADVFVQIEKMIMSLLNTYTGRAIPGASAEVMHKQSCLIAMRIGALFVNEKKRPNWVEELRLIEEKVRGKLDQRLLPPPVVPAESVCSQPPDAATCSLMLPDAVDAKPALAFNDLGEIQEDLASSARTMGLAVGSSCFLSRASRGIDKMRLGTLTGLSGKGKDAQVHFHPTEDGLVEEVKDIPLSFLRLYEPPAPVKQKKGDGSAMELTSGVQPVVKLPEAISWSAGGDQVMEEIVSHALLSFERRLAVQRAPNFEEVCVLETPRILIAKQTLPPLSLRIVPYGKSLTKCAKPKGRAKGSHDWTTTMQTTEDVEYWKRADLQPDAGAQTKAVLVVDLASFLLASSTDATSYPVGCVVLKSVESGPMVFKVGEYSTTDVPLKPGKNDKGGFALEATCRYWTNDCEVPRGFAIAPPGAKLPRAEPAAVCSQAASASSAPALVCSQAALKSSAPATDID